MSESINQVARVFQALLFTSQTPLSLDTLLKAFGDETRQPERSLAKAALAQLIEETQSTSLELVELGSGYTYRVRQAYAEYIALARAERPPRYSRALLETLALVAYRQPITRGEIEEVRGVSVSSQIVRTLEEREWIRVVGHREAPGRPALYATTRQFLDYFHLKSLNDLPPLEEIRALADLEAQQEWQDDLDQVPISPLLTQVDDEEDLADAADSPLDEDPLPEVKPLTWTELAERFDVQRPDDESTE